MHRKLLIAGVSILVLSSGATWSQSETSSDAGDRKFTLIAPNTEQTDIDLGRRGPSQGDLFIFSGPLRDGRGETKGRLDGHCITVSTPDRDDREQDRRQCFVTSTIGTADGETEIQAAGVGRILAEDVLFSITGGTNRFKRARGQALFDYSREGRVKISYELFPEK